MNVIVEQHNLPVQLQRLLKNAAWQPISIGCSGNDVFRITLPNHSVYYLKRAPRLVDAALHAEKARLEWLHGRLPVPTVEAFIVGEQHTYLLLSAVPGVIACDRMVFNNVPRLVHALADGLRMIHDVSYLQCPFEQRIKQQLAHAQQRVVQGLVEPSDISSGRSPRDVLADLLVHQPTHEELAFTHGDPSLPNILIDSETMHITGFIDVGSAGIADRYLDLAISARSLAYNFGPGHEALLWKAYGLDQVDQDKIWFYQQIDDLL